MTPKQEAEHIISKHKPHAKYWDCRNDEPLKEFHAGKSAEIEVNSILKMINDCLILSGKSSLVYKTFEARNNHYKRVRTEIRKQIKRNENSETIFK